MLKQRCLVAKIGSRNHECHCRSLNRAFVGTKKLFVSMAIPNDFKKLKRPKLALTEDVILISDPPIGMRIFLTLLCLLFAMNLFFEGIDDNFWGFIIFSCLALVFLYDALSLNRAKVDLKRKAIFRTTLNPIANLLDRILQHPSVIPFDKITKFGVEYPLRGGPYVPRFYLYVEYDGIYKLTIGIFKKGDEAEGGRLFARKN